MSAILDKVRKLLTLSRKSCNANEAAAAAAAAQRLMTEHQIAEAELETGGPQERATLSSEPLDTFGKTSIAWKEVLCANLAKLHGCASWRLSEFDGKGGTVRKLQLVGRPSDVATVRYLYAWLTSEIERLVQRNGLGRGRVYAKSYRIGALNGCLETMRAARQEARAAASGAALVRVDARLAEAEAEALRSASTPIKPATPASFRSGPAAFERGRVAGQGLHTGAELGATTGARLLGDGS